MPSDGSVPLQTLLLSGFTPNFNVGLLIAIIALVIMSGFFSSTETAYSCANKIKLRSLVSNGNKRAKNVLHLAETNYDRFISTVLIGNNIVNLSATTLATIFFANLIADGNTSAVVSTAVMTVAVLIFGEITPKFLAKTFPEKFSMAFYPIIKFFYYLFFPLNLIFGGWKWMLSKVFRLKNAEIVTEDEIMTIVEEAEEDGTLGTEETQLIRSVIEFDDLEVGDILVPRVNIVGVDIASSMEDIRKVFNREGYSRVPVYKDSIDTIIGTIHEKDFFNAYLNGKKGIDGIMQNAFYTTEHAKISDLLRQLQKKKVHIAVVLDEYGGTLGLVTLEDILEELVGEIYDEHDEIINYYKQLSSDTFLIDGNAPLDDTFEYLGLPKNEDEEFEAITVSGWIIELLGEIPKAGEKLTHKNLDVEVLKSTVKKILQVKIVVNPLEETEEE
ncbi:MAG: HlyC/CorC family transporter [Clostridiales bacterium]|nr:HlyC/CorC family transporter [Clostridiales bacterium]MBQ3046698.1 HlyC/CorC family transporter [Clostridia bacterium]